MDRHELQQLESQKRDVREDIKLSGESFGPCASRVAKKFRRARRAIRERLNKASDRLASR